MANALGGIDKIAIQQVQPVPERGARGPLANQGIGGPDFKQLLESKVKSPAALKEAPELKFSTHALERMHSRGISFKDGDLKRISEAVDRASKKGSRDTLVLLGESAFIVNVKNKTVVTAMDKNLMKENVFTNIDSTVIL